MKTEKRQGSKVDVWMTVTFNQLAMANSMFVWSYIEEIKWSRVEMGITA